MYAMNLNEARSNKMHNGSEREIWRSAAETSPASGFLYLWSWLRCIASILIQIIKFHVSTFCIDLFDHNVQIYQKPLLFQGYNQADTHPEHKSQISEGQSNSWPNQPLGWQNLLLPSACRKFWSQEMIPDLPFEGYVTSLNLQWAYCWHHHPAPVIVRIR